MCPGRGDGGTLTAIPPSVGLFYGQPVRPFIGINRKPKKLEAGSRFVGTVLAVTRTDRSGWFTDGSRADLYKRPFFMVSDSRDERRLEMRDPSPPWVTAPADITKSLTH